MSIPNIHIGSRLAPLDNINSELVLRNRRRQELGSDAVKERIRVVPHFVTVANASPLQLPVRVRFQLTTGTHMNMIVFGCLYYLYDTRNGNGRCHFEILNGEHAGTVYNSLSEAGRALYNEKRVNGWQRWIVDDVVIPDRNTGRTIIGCLPIGRFRESKNGPGFLNSPTYLQTAPAVAKSNFMEQLRRLKLRSIRLKGQQLGAQSAIGAIGATDITGATTLPASVVTTASANQPSADDILGVSDLYSLPDMAATCGSVSGACDTVYGATSGAACSSTYTAPAYNVLYTPPAQPHDSAAFAMLEAAMYTGYVDGLAAPPCSDDLMSLMSLPVATILDEITVTNETAPVMVPSGQWPAGSSGPSVQTGPLGPHTCHAAHAGYDVSRSGQACVVSDADGVNNVSNVSGVSNVSYVSNTWNGAPSACTEAVVDPAVDRVPMVYEAPFDQMTALAAQAWSGVDEPLPEYDEAMFALPADFEFPMADEPIDMGAAFEALMAQNEGWTV
jgi:hypothetical protein